MVSTNFELSIRELTKILKLKLEEARKNKVTSSLSLYANITRDAPPKAAAAAPKKPMKEDAPPLSKAATANMDFEDWLEQPVFPIMLERGGTISEASRETPAPKRRLSWPALELRPAHQSPAFDGASVEIVVSGARSSSTTAALARDAAVSSIVVATPDSHSHDLTRMEGDIIFIAKLEVVGRSPINLLPPNWKLQKRRKEIEPKMRGGVRPASSD
ncbi:unnamed protein product [Linum trigynum]|uniref:Uncharacterized protein n=1 Tax=Linum trigynum TaxID=586398 RepID=A0AAV2EDM9_9ROSI